VSFTSLDLPAYYGLLSAPQPQPTGLKPLIDCILSNEVPQCYAVVNGKNVSLSNQSYTYDGTYVYVTGVVNLNQGDLLTNIVCQYEGINVFSFYVWFYASAAMPVFPVIRIAVGDGGNRPARIAIFNQCAMMDSCNSYTVDATSGRCDAFIASLPFGGRITTDCIGICIDGQCYNQNQISVVVQPGAHIISFTGPRFGIRVGMIPCTLTVGAATYNINVYKVGM